MMLDIFTLLYFGTNLVNLGRKMINITTPGNEESLRKWFSALLESCLLLSREIGEPWDARYFYFTLLWCCLLMLVFFGDFTAFFAADSLAAGVFAAEDKKRLLAAWVEFCAFSASVKKA
jgi:hypothetical protein